MTILSLAALPAATNVARDAVAGSAEVGKSFLNMLAGLTGGAANDAPTEQATALSASSAVSTDTITERTGSLSQRLANWLRQQSWLKAAHNGDGPVTLELSLDQLDRPQAKLDGQPSAELNAALANDPSWLDEFRQLALDRIEQMGPTSSNSSLQSLTIQQESATIAAEHRWNLP